MNPSQPKQQIKSAEHTEPAPSPKPPNGPSLSTLLFIALALVAGAVGGVFFSPKLRPIVGLSVTPMAAKKASTGKIGDMAGMPGMPGMADSADAGDSASMAPMPDAHEAEHDHADFYTCGMHPWVVLPEPGNCPICHMELVPLDPDKFTGEVTIDPIVTQNIGVRIAPVVQGPVVKNIRTVGAIEYDETRVRDVNIKASGWIEKLYVDYVGAPVKKGEPLFEFYSPKLYAAQSEYLTTMKMTRASDATFLPGSDLDTARLIRDARVQLEYYDITDAQIDQLETTGAPSKAITIYSPYTGVVIAKHANEGMPVDIGMRVYQIADLSKVWVMVSLYEYQLPLVQLDQLATMSLSYIPGQTFTGRVLYIYPYLDEKTRQAKVRLEFDNPTGLLKPGMYVSVDLKSTLADDRVLAPREAVIDTGRRQVAFVSLGDGKFEPRDVQLGVETEGGNVEILDGLKPGEMVVTSGQFLLDSESRLRESLAKMVKGQPAADQNVVTPVAAPASEASVPNDIQRNLATVLTNYFAIGDLLAKDTIFGVDQPAKEVAAAVDRMISFELPGEPDFWRQHDEAATIGGKAQELSQAKNIKSARLAFADLSVALAKLVRATGVPADINFPVEEMHCPMFRGGQGGSVWLQRAGDVRNPFFGSVMLQCFDERTAMPATGAAP